VENVTDKTALSNIRQGDFINSKKQEVFMISKKRWIREKKYLLIKITGTYNPKYEIKKCRNKIYGKHKETIWFTIPIDEFKKVVSK